jgi:predicted nucleic acid-binding protein
MIAVADTGPLIALAKVNALELLNPLYEKIIVPPTVFTEAVTAGFALNAPDASLLNDAFTSGRLQVQTPTLSVLPVPYLLHPGENESIRLAIELQSDWLLIDDMGARQGALANLTAAGVSTLLKGTLGIIVTAHIAKELDRQQAIDIINRLKARPDIWLSRKLCDQVIRTLQST